ncbi:MAG TPA: ABC transporter substrate-binding protein [Bacilli bacterium]
MNRSRKTLSWAMAILLLISVTAGCAKNTTKETSMETPQASSATETETPQATEEPKKDFTLKFAISAKSATSDENVKLMELASERAGVKVEPLVLAGEGVEFDQKLMLSLMAGEGIDIIYTNNASILKYIASKTAAPLEDLAAESSYDMDKVFGKYLKKDEGRVYGLPAFVDIWITLYNKKLFDDAKIPYPTASDWTWNKYVETAKKLTDASKGIYGSYMLDYDVYNYMRAKQLKVKEYKDDGTSNFDDPAYAESMKFFYDLGNAHKVQPDFLTFKSKKLAWDGFTNGQYAMHVNGGWSIGLMSDPKAWPRDWKFGLLPMPSVDGAKKSTLSVTGMYVIPSTSKHKKEAFAAITAMAEKQYTLGSGRIPARVDLTDEEIAAFITNNLAKPYANDGVTVEDFKAAFFNKDQDVVDEKMIGPGSTKINQAFISEGELYGLGQKTLEDAMKAIKEKADTAIKEEKEAGQ